MFKILIFLFLKLNKDFYKFGYEVEDIYVELVFDGKYYEYYFFRRFKMFFYRNLVKCIKDKKIKVYIEKWLIN